MNQLLNIMPILTASTTNAPDAVVAGFPGTATGVAIDFGALLAQLALGGGIVSGKQSPTTLIPIAGLAGFVSMDQDAAVKCSPGAIDQETVIPSTTNIIDPLLQLALGAMPVGGVSPQPTVALNPNMVNTVESLLAGMAKSDKPPTDMIAISSPTRQIMVSVDQLLAALQSGVEGAPVTISPIEVLPGSSAPASSAALLVPASLTVNEVDFAKMQLLPAITTMPTVNTDGSPVLPIGNAKTAPVFQPIAKTPDLTNLESRLKEQFPSLKIDAVKVEVALDLTPATTLRMPLEIKLPEVKPVFALSPDPRVELQTPVTKVVLETPIVPQTPAIKVAVLETPIVPQQVGPVALSPVVAASSQVEPEVSGAKTKSPALAKAGVTLVETSLQIGSKQIVVQTSESSGDLSQSASNWSNAWGDRQMPTKVEVIASPQIPQPEKPKFKIEFNRFQIDALLKRSEMRIQLHPSYLGTMNIKLVSTPQEMTARFETATEAARAAVEQNLPQLRENLERAGIKVDRVEVVVDDQYSRQQEQAQNQNRNRQSRTSNLRQALTVDTEATGGGNANSSGALTLGNLNLLA
jgi:hypothetical protein